MTVLPEFGELSGNPRRVKVYLLQGEDWIDNGTGYCVGEVDAQTRKPYFLVRNELNTDEIILKSFLEGSIQYQRQQETLIVWTDLLGKDLALSFQETEACADLCEFIIRIQQEKFAPEISLYYVIPNNNVVDEELGSAGFGSGSISGSDGSAGAAGSVQPLPPPTEITELITGPISFPEVPATLANLDHTLELINQGSNSQYTRGKIAAFVKDEQYLVQLVALFHEAEQKHQLTNLHILCECVKTLILYNEASIIEDFVMSEDKIYGLVSILEYDQEYPSFKASYREYLGDKTKLKTVIQLPDDESLRIFKNDFHLKFLKDVVLARFLDDETFNLISSLIYFNQVDIINFLKDSDGENKFLENLFALYNVEAVKKPDSRRSSRFGGSTNSHAAPSIPNGKRGSDASKDARTSQTSQDSDIESKRDGVKLLHQYVLIAKSLQSFQKAEFFSALVKKGLFKMVGFALKDLEPAVRTLGTELIVVIIEQDVSLVNSIDNDIDNSDPPDQRLGEKDADVTIESKLHLKLSDDMTLMQILTKLLIEDKNPGLKFQAFEALRILLDSNIASSSQSPKNEFEIDLLLKNELKSGGGDDFNDINTNNYFQAFYLQVAPELFSELIVISGESESDPKVADTLLLQQLCELISFCTREHDPSISKPFFIENDIILGLGKVISFNHSKPTLKLSAIRCLKSIILLNDSDYFDYIIDKKILNFFFKYFKTISNKNNLANSACLDFLELITKNSNNPNFRKLAEIIYQEEKEFLATSLEYVSTGEDLIRLFDKPEIEMSVHSASTPILYEPEDEEEGDDGEGDFEIDEIDIDNDDDHDKGADDTADTDTSSGAKVPVNLFEGIESEIRNREKRHLEEDGEISTESDTKVIKTETLHDTKEKNNNGATSNGNEEMVVN